VVSICNLYIAWQRIFSFEPAPAAAAASGAAAKGGHFAMGKRTSHKDAGCPVARPLDAIGDWWSLLIIRDAFDGLRRFGEFQKNLGLAKNILSARLHNLVEHGILDVVPASDGSPYQEYVLTGKGRGLFAPEEQHVLLVDKKHGLPVRRLELRSQDGRALGAEDTTVRLVADRAVLSKRVPRR
jgi:DNA-binding HxlR family transcriptional regulator